MRIRPRAGLTFLFPLLLLAAACGEDKSATPGTPSTLPVATLAPSPTPDPKCSAGDLLLTARLQGVSIRAWGLGENPLLHCDPLDPLGQELPDTCPGVQVAGWDQPLGSATCNYQGPEGRRTNALVCKTAGDSRVGCTINQLKAGARFSILGPDEIATLEGAGINAWRYLTPLEVRADLARLRK